MTANVTQEEFLVNHAFALFFTAVAAASQGLGGLIAVLGIWRTAARASRT